jgi:hypothetical protein
MLFIAQMRINGPGIDRVEPDRILTLMHEEGKRNSF